MLNLPAYKMVM